jgi:hypothetical protein
MSFPLNISFKDTEFEKVQRAAKGEPVREFVKTAAIKEAERINAGE